MPRSNAWRDRLSTLDWRAWIALAWAVWFGLLYGRMVVELRGGKLAAAVSRVATGANELPGRDGHRTIPRAFR